MRHRWLALGLMLTSGAGLLVLDACSSDDVASNAPSNDGGTGGSDSAAPPTPGNDASPGDGGAPGDGGGTVQSFTVPAGGGSIDVSGKSMKLTFQFPASAAGKTITFEPKAATDIGWPAGQFAEVIKLGPDGERFADPILVKPENPKLVSALLSFADGTGKGAASPVPLSADGKAFEVRHFSSLVVVSAGRLCDSEGYNDTPDAAYCATAVAGHTTQRVTTCKGYSYCLNVSLTCCVDPTSDAGGCTWADAPLLGTQTPTDSNGGQYPYCEGDAGDWDGGASGCLNPKPAYAFKDAGCSTIRYECPDGQGAFNYRYEMQCNGATCQCQYAGPNPVNGPSFAQGATCDNTATMRTAYVQKCNYPANL